MLYVSSNTVTELFIMKNHLHTSHFINSTLNEWGNNKDVFVIL